MPCPTGLLASAKGCLFAGEPRNFALRYVSWGNRKPGGCRRGDKAEARRAASAQAAFPSRRAREKAVPEKGRGIFCFVRVFRAG